eukprot:scaffold1493_cov66-Phaeocystis_antarctica.AAC.8
MQALGEVASTTTIRNSAWFRVAGHRLSTAAAQRGPSGPRPTNNPSSSCAPISAQALLCLWSSPCTTGVYLLSVSQSLPHS